MSWKLRVCCAGFAMLLCLLAAEPRLAAQDSVAIPQAPVLVDGKVLFQVRGVLSFTSETRAAAIAQRIQELSEDVTVNPASLTVVQAEGTSEIVSADRVLMSVTDLDASLAGRSQQELANDYAGRIRAAVTAMRQEYSTKSLLLGGVYAAAATLGLLLLFWILGLLFPRIYSKIEAWRGTRISSLRIQEFELLPADRIAGLALGAVRLLRIVLTLVILYFYTSLVLGFFPWTRGYARLLLGYVLAPLKVVGEAVLAYLPNIFFILVISVVAYYAIRLTQILFAEVGKQTITLPNFHHEWAGPIYKIVRFLMLALTAIVIFPYLPGAKSPAFQGISIFIGVLFSLGSSSAIASIVAGIILTYMRAFKLGDRVKIADTVGDVVEVSLLITRVRTIKNVEITIANAMVLGSHIINYSTSAEARGLILHTEVTIGYDAPWRSVHELLLSAAAATENILIEPKPFILQTALDDFYVHYELNAFTSVPGCMARTYSDLHQNIQDKFNEAGVEIMSPHYATVRDGNRIAIPDDYLPKGYETPSFKVGLGGLGNLGNLIDAIANPAKPRAKS